jgi:hypothetical protein
MSTYSYQREKPDAKTSVNGPKLPCSTCEMEETIMAAMAAQTE